MENTQELLKIIEQLKKENKALKEDKANLEVELYETNKRLNEALSTISSLQEKEKIKKNKENNEDPLKEKEYVNNIPVNPKEQKQLIGKNVSQDSLKLNPYVKNVNFESNKINPRFSRFNYNFVQQP